MQGGKEGERDVPVIMASPSFREPADHRHESPQQIPAAAKEPLPQDDGGRGDDSDIDVDDDFEFAFVIKNPETGPAITADEIFSNGRIRPVYPVFGRSLLLADDGRGVAPAPADGEDKTAAVRGTLRRLLIEDRDDISGSSSSSSGADDLEGIPPGTYCVWTPGSSAAASPSRCGKSSSTGSALRWRLRDLVFGRSHSDGKEKFVFLAAEEKKKKKKGKESPSRGTKGAAAEKTMNAKAKAKAKGKGGKLTEVDVVTAHRIYYGKSSPARSGAARRSFLPYNPALVGFFANVNGISRTHHPF